MAIWSSSLKTPEEIYRACKAEVEFTHPNKLVQDAIYLYSVAIQYLLLNPADPDRAQNAFKYAYEQSGSDLANFVSEENEQCK